MSTRDLLLEGLEQAINALIGLDESAAARLAGLHGKRIALDLRGLGVRLIFVPGASGRLQLLGSLEGEPDATLSGSPLDLLRSSDPTQGARQLFGGRVSMTGNTSLAQEFGAILGGLDIDWEEQLSRLTGDLIAHKAGQDFRKVSGYTKTQGKQMLANLGEYLTEEARMLPHPLQVAEFVQQVDGLRERFDRLQARIAILERKP